MTGACLVCEASTDRRIEGRAGADVHLCEVCWSDRADDRVKVPLADRGILSQVALGGALELFYDHTEPTDDHALPEIVGIVRESVVVTTIRRGEPVVLAHLAGREDWHDGWRPYDAVTWAVEEPQTPVVALAIHAPLAGDYDVMKSALHVAETDDALYRALSDHAHTRQEVDRRAAR